MGVKYILSQAGAKMGLNPNSPDSRSVLLRFANEAADELYPQADPPGSLLEQCFKINGDQTVALPSYVGEIRAMREFNSQIPWTISQMRPRYNVANWPDMWRNFRLKGKQALMRAVVNQSHVVVTVPSVETPPIVVTVSGPTANATMMNEILIMDTTSKTSTNQFLDLSAAKKDRVNTVDVTISDIDGNLLTAIPNNELQAIYQIIDVSSLPWLNQDQDSQAHYVEILYKKPLPVFLNDGDEYPAIGYDNIIVNKMMQLWAEEQGKTDQALGYDAKATRSMARKIEEQNRATVDTVAFVPNGHDELLVKIRGRRYGRYRGYIYPYGLR